MARLEPGHTSRVKQISATAEYRIDWGPRYRIYLAKDGWGAHPPRQRSNGKASDEWNSADEAFQRDRRRASSAQPPFTKPLLDEAATLLLNGEVSAAGLVLRDFVNATVGFEARASEAVKPAKSLHRTLSRNGNPKMDNLAAILTVVRKRLGVEIQAHAMKAA